MKKIIFTTISILVSCVSFSQQISLTITDSLTNELLPFATVYLKNTGIGITSNFNGKAKFKFKAAKNNDTLVCSYVGYQTKEFLVYLAKPTNTRKK